MIKRLIILTVAVLFSLTCIKCFCEENTILSKQEVFQIYESKLKELKLPLIDLDKIKYDIFNAEIETEGGKKLWDVACLHGGATMDIDPSSGRVVTFLNDAYYRELEKTTFAEKPKPTKNQEEIISEAEKYIKIINSEMPKNVCFSEAKFKYDTNGLKLGFYHDGEWQILFRRIEGNYKYWQDYISISISEKYGLTGYRYEFFSQFHPPKKINISEEKAISIAKKNINKIIHSPLVGGWYNGYKTGECHSAGLIIVNPNYIHIPSKGYSFTPQPYARLAWVIGFQSLNMKTNKEDILTSSMIWIDAETGEVLGGG